MIVVNKRLRPKVLLSLIRRRARVHDLTLEELPWRGKGSHRLYVLLDHDGREVARFMLTGHAKELEWPVLRDIEARLADALEDKKWMEDR
jgi:hypothetical protein